MFDKKLSFIFSNFLYYCIINAHALFSRLIELEICGLNTTKKIDETIEYQESYWKKCVILSDQNPAPRNVSLLNISDSSAIVRWTAIRKSEWRYDRLAGYRINLANKSVRLNYTIPNDVLKFSLTNLSHSTNYEVSVTGIGKNFEGKSSGWMKFKTSGKCWCQFMTCSLETHVL